MMHPSPPRILIVDDSPEVCSVAKMWFENESYLAWTADSLAGAREKLLARTYDAVIIDVRLGDGSGIDLVAQAREPRDGMLPPAIVMLTVVGEFSAKLEAVRHGADAYFEKPADWPAIARKVAQIVAQRRNRPVQKILVVEDDPAQAVWMRATLVAGGFDVVLCDGPRTFDDALRAVRPDLILMDIDLPSASGYDLARYLRQQEHYATVPVVFLSALQTEDVELTGLLAGGEGFLRKPVSPERLVASVRAWLDRVGPVKELLETDDLAGVLTRRSFDQRLARAIAEQRRDAAAQFSLAMLDIDAFKTVNDTFGHAAGDRVIVALASFLTARLRATETVGRLGGDEFGILFHDTSAEVAKSVLGKLLEAFRSLKHGADDGRSFSASFSAGIAELVHGMTAAGWKASADASLYDAKRGGRDRVAIAADAGTDFLPVLDSSTISDLEELGRLSRSDVLSELTDLFAQEVAGRVETICVAVAARDCATVAHGVHAFFSAAGNIGAVRLAAVCEQMEVAARRNDDAEVRRLEPSLVIEAEAARVALLKRRIP